jgi:hypothetical protein
MLVVSVGQVIPIGRDGGIAVQLENKKNNLEMLCKKESGVLTLFLWSMFLMVVENGVFVRACADCVCGLRVIHSGAVT